MIKSKKLQKIKNLQHGFFNRQGGVSKGIYKSLNCGLGSNDNKKDVKENLQIIKKKIGLKKGNILFLHQIHSNKFVFFKKPLKKKKFRADALITSLKKIPLAILTADCVPVLIFDKKKKMIAAIHSGWKGAYKGIIKKVLSFMILKGCNPKNMISVIGPCISVKNYEIKGNFMKKFLNKDKKNKVHFYHKKNKIFFNLRKYVYFELKKFEIKDIDIIKKDTFDIKNNFFSARRSLKKKENDYGRNISLIMIN